ncbi:MAG: polyphenol oxidase family protein [Gemmatimonas sp.]
MPTEARRLPVLDAAEAVSRMPAGIAAWTTTRANGSFGLGSDEPVGAVMGRWAALQQDLTLLGVTRLASAHQVHGATVQVHDGGWQGWLRGAAADGHVTTARGTAVAVTVADCTPVFVWHPGGAIAALHAGWRGTAARILDRGLDQFDALGFPADECEVYLGPSICGACYEVGPEVFEAITGRASPGKGCLDVRAVLADQAAKRRVRDLRSDPGCSLCDQSRFFSHRGGDAGRMLGLVALL